MFGQARPASARPGSAGSPWKQDKVFHARRPQSARTPAPVSARIFAAASARALAPLNKPKPRLHPEASRALRRLESAASEAAGAAYRAASLAELAAAAHAHKHACSVASILAEEAARDADAAAEAALEADLARDPSDVVIRCHRPMSSSDVVVRCHRPDCQQQLGMLRAAEDAAKRARVQYFAKRGLAEGAQRIYKQKAVAAEAAAGTSVVATHAAAQAENEFLAVKESLGHEYMRGVAGALNVAGSAGAASATKLDEEGMFVLSKTWVRTHVPIGEVVLARLRQLVEQHFVEEADMASLGTALRLGTLLEGAVEDLIRKEEASGVEMVPAGQWTKHAVLELVEHRRWRLVLLGLERA